MVRLIVALLLVALLPTASADALEATSAKPVQTAEAGLDLDGVPLLHASVSSDAVAVAVPVLPLHVRVDLPALGPPAIQPSEAAVAARPEGTRGEAHQGAAPGSAIGIAAGASLAAGLAAFGWGLLRAFGLAPLVPSFSRIEDGRLADHPARRRALDVIQAKPGATIQEVRAALGLAWGTTVHHLRRLERAGLIAVRRDGGRRGHWPLGQAPPRDGMSSADRGVAALVKSSPGLAQNEIARLSGVGAPAACKRLGRLEEAGLVAQVRDGRTRLYVPTARLLAMDLVLPASARAVDLVAAPPAHAAEAIPA